MNAWNIIVQQHMKAVEKYPLIKKKREMKQCSKCGQILSLDCFFKRSDVDGGHRARCKECYGEDSENAISA